MLESGVARWFARAGIALVAVAATLLVLEGLLRLLGFSPEVAVATRPDYEKFEPDPDLIWALKKSWQGSELNGRQVRVGSLGFRGPELAPEAARRVLFLGDSVVYGHFLSNVQALPTQLQRALRSQGERRVEVINAGVPGYSTFQQAALYRTRGRPLEPDLVLLGFCLNDVTERYVSVEGFGGPRFFMQNVDTARAPGPLARLWLGSALRTALTRSARGLSERREIYNVESLWLRADSPEILDAWELVFAELDELIASVRADGARLAVVVFPYRAQLGQPGASIPQQALADFFEAREVDWLDLLPVLEKEAAVDPLFLDVNHPTPQGAARWARTIAAFLVQRGLL